MKNFNVWFRNCNKKMYNTVHDVQKALQENVNEINTYNVIMATGDLVDRGYIIKVYPYKGGEFAIEIGMPTVSGREIRKTHNLARLLISGEFDTDSICVTGK